MAGAVPDPQPLPPKLQSAEPPISPSKKFAATASLTIATKPNTNTTASAAGTAGAACAAGQSAPSAAAVPYFASADPSSARSGGKSSAAAMKHVSPPPSQSSVMDVAGARDSIHKVSVTSTLVPESPLRFDDDGEGDDDADPDPEDSDPDTRPTATASAPASVAGNRAPGSGSGSGGGPAAVATSSDAAVAPHQQPHPSATAAGSHHHAAGHGAHAHVPAHAQHHFHGTSTLPIPATDLANPHAHTAHAAHAPTATAAPPGSGSPTVAATAAAPSCAAVGAPTASAATAAGAASAAAPKRKLRKKFARPAEQLLHLKGTKKKLVVGMVGLPARGKTYIAKKLTRYLNWLGYRTRLFNIGEYRRKNVGAEQHAEFFDPNNKQAVAVREEMAVAALTDMFKFFADGGQAAIYDGTNSIRSRRKMVQNFIKTNSGDMQVELMWVESVCSDAKIVEENIRATKLFSPDYAHMSAEAAIDDFRKRIAMYEKAYETLSDESDAAEQNVAFVKLIDVGRSMISNRISGYLPGRIVFFLMNLRINKDAIFISRHGESQFNVNGRIGGDSPLTEKGRDYARALSQFMETQPEVIRAGTGGVPPLSVWCSTLKRTVETVQELKQRDNAVQWRALTEIQVGICDGMTYEEIEKKYPDEFKARAKDKLGYRYPQGESYIDVITRLEPVIFELERIRGPVLVVGHRAVLRCLYAYFLDMPIEDIPYLEVPLHTVIKLVPKAYGCTEVRHQIGVQTTTDLKQDHKLT